jgi:DNA-binding beta-propeller fold protein YncE
VKRLTILLAALGALLLVSAAPALATEGEIPFKETFGPSAQPTFTVAAGLAVDPASGDLYVIDAEEQILYRYNEDGTPHNFSALAGNAIDGHAGEPDEVTSGFKEILTSESLIEFGAPSPFEVEVAVAPPGAPNAGDIYVTDGYNERIVAFSSSGEYLAQKSFGYSCGVAVDPAGNVYVAEPYGGGSVHKLSPTLVEEATYSVPGPCQLAASEGFVYATQGGGPVSKVASEGAEEGETEYTIDAATSSEIAIDPVGGHLFLVKPGETGRPIREYDVSGASPELLSSTQSATKEGWGVAVNGASDNLYVSRFEVASVETYSLASEPVIEGPPLTLNIEEGEGTVVSNPAGIECVGAAPTSCESEFEENEAVTLTASPAPGFLFKGWKKCDKGGAVGRQCTVTMSEAKEVGAKFIASFDVTLQNGGGGKVYSKPGGALCMPNCTEVTASFKEGKPVEVLNKPNKHFHLVEYGGDCSGTSCTGLEANSTVSAVFAEDPTQTLSLAKEGGGQGLIKSKPAGLNCTYTCSFQEVAFYEEAIEISWKLGKGTSSLEWTGGAGTCTGTTEAETGSCSVTMSAAKSLVAKFE